MLLSSYHWLTGQLVLSANRHHLWKYVRGKSSELAYLLRLSNRLFYLASNSAVVQVTLPKIHMFWGWNNLIGVQPSKLSLCYLIQMSNPSWLIGFVVSADNYWVAAWTALKLIHIPILRKRSRKVYHFGQNYVLANCSTVNLTQVICVTPTVSETCTVGFRQKNCKKQKSKPVYSNSEALDFPSYAFESLVNIKIIPLFPPGKRMVNPPWTSFISISNTVSCNTCRNGKHAALNRAILSKV